MDSDFVNIRVKKKILKGLDNLGAPYEILPSLAKETSKGPEIITLSDRWLIEVPHRGKTDIYELCQEMLPSRNFADTINHAKNARAQGKFSPRDSQFNFAAFKSIVDSSNNKKDKIIGFWKSELRRTFPSTTSLAVYNYDGEENDKFIHDVGMSEEYECPIKIIGSNRKIIQEESSILEAMVGEDTQEVERVIRAINKTPTYIYRLNSSSHSCDKRVVRFNANSDRFNLNAYRNLSNRNPSFE